MRIVEHATKISLTSSTNRSKINEQRGLSPVCFFLVHVRHENKMAISIYCIEKTDDDFNYYFTVFLKRFVLLPPFPN